MTLPTDHPCISWMHLRLSSRGLLQWIRSFGENRVFSDIIFPKFCFALDISSVIFAWFCLFYRTRDLYVSTLAICSEIFRSLIASTTRYLPVVFCHLTYCRIGDTSAAQYVPPIAGSGLLCSVHWGAQSIVVSNLDKRHARGPISNIFQIGEPEVKLEDPGKSGNFWCFFPLSVAQCIFIRYIPTMSGEPIIPYDADSTISSVTFKPAAFISHDNQVQFKARRTARQMTQFT